MSRHVNQTIRNRKCNLGLVVCNFHESDRIVGTPVIISVELEEFGEYLIRTGLREVLTNLSNKNSPSNSS